MSLLTCRNCGSTTNTAVSDWLDSKDDKADSCYLKWEDRWVKGCSYEEADSYTKPFCDKLLAGE